MLIGVSCDELFLGRAMRMVRGREGSKWEGKAVKNKKRSRNSLRWGRKTEGAADESLPKVCACSKESEKIRTAELGTFVRRVSISPRGTD